MYTLVKEENFQQTLKQFMASSTEGIEGIQLDIHQFTTDFYGKKFFESIEKLINSCLIMVVPPPQTIKVEKRTQTKKPSFIIRLLGYAAINAPVKVVHSNISQEDTSCSPIKRDHSTFSLRSQSSLDKHDGMLNISQCLDLENASNNRERETSTREASVLCIRYFINSKLTEFTWRACTFNLEIISRPFIIMTQTSQTVHGIANLEWYKHFRLEKSKPWDNFKVLLNKYHQQETNKILNKSQLDYLKSRFSNYKITNKFSPINLLLLFSD